jgi:hypothetical protein
MILNAFALTSLFVGIISLCLIVMAAATAVSSRRRLKKSRGADERASAEDRIHLSLLLLFTAFLLRLTTWPLFYILLHSLIPLVPGAMCIFGVTQVMPSFVAFIQILKPLAFFLVGGWVIFYGLDLTLKTRLLVGQSVTYLMVVSTVAALDAAAELLFVFLFAPPGVAVSCCTAIADLVIPSSPLLPLPLFGARYDHLLVVLYHTVSLGMVALMGFLIWRKLVQRFALNLVGLGTIANGGITYGAFKEYLGPHLMGLPDHHCLYCLLQYRPVSILILGLFILGSFSAVWPLLLRRVATSNQIGERVSILSLKLLKCSVTCLLASYVLTSIWT